MIDSKIRHYKYICIRCFGKVLGESFVARDERINGYIRHYMCMGPSVDIKWRIVS